MSMYRFNNMSGKIIGGAGQRLGQAIKGSVQDTPQIIFESSKVKFPTVIQTVTPTKPGFGEVPSFLIRKYEHFQKDNGVPIHLKGGTTDVILYYVTLLGCAIGLEECFRFYYESAFPKKE